MSSKITINYDKSIDKLIEKLKILAKNENAYLKGNSNQGEFEVKSNIGTFKGTYNVKNSLINILIEKKPFFISTKIIEREIKKYLE